MRFAEKTLSLLQCEGCGSQAALRRLSQAAEAAGQPVDQWPEIKPLQM
jgi:hypothetical protein